MFTQGGQEAGIVGFRRHFLVWEAGRWKEGREWDGMVDRVLLGLEGPADGGRSDHGQDDGDEPEGRPRDVVQC